VIKSSTEAFKSSSVEVKSTNASNNDLKFATYLGCFIDKADHAVPNKVADPGKRQGREFIDDCLKSAVKNDAKVFSVQNGDECYFGSDEKSHEKYGLGNACNTYCNGATSGVKCGGVMQQDVYKVLFR